MGSYKIGLALVGRGAANHLNRLDVVNSFRDRGIDVSFLVREDFKSHIKKIEGCEYTFFRFKRDNDTIEYLRNALQFIRALYPAYDKEVKWRFNIQNKERPLRSRIIRYFMHLMARFRVLMRIVLALESLLYRQVAIPGLDESGIDQLLLVGTGALRSEAEGIMTWWARGKGISVVHAVANYDNLSSKGYRGTKIDRLLVWGPSMRDDALHLQGIPDEKITAIGSLRYNSIEGMIDTDRDSFLKSCGLDPDKKTIFFAGANHEYHYFEMLEIFKEFKKQGENYQLILRVYPDNVFTGSAYMQSLISFANALPDVHVSLAVLFSTDAAWDKEIIHIEEAFLWHAIKYSDLVTHLYSTIALEACIFDKPVIAMWYLPKPVLEMIRPQIFWDFPNQFHNRRLATFGAMTKVSDRAELMEAIEDALKNPDRLKAERKYTVEQECGVLDGNACHRLAEACIAAYTTSG